MSDLHAALEDVRRRVRSRPDSLERVHARYRRRERNRRLAAGAVAAIVATAGISTVVGLMNFAEREPAAPPIREANVPRLAPAWATTVSGAGSSAVAIADGALYVATDAGRLLSLDAGTGKIRWTGDIQPGTPTEPVVAEGMVLVHVGGKLAAFDVGCAVSGERCTPWWTATVGGANLAPPVVAGGVAYVVSSPGGLSAFPLDCDDRCEPLWTTDHLSGQIAHAAAVADGVVWDSSAHSLFAFPATCVGTCSPLVRAIRPSGAELSSGPTVSGGVIYVGSNDGRLYAVPAGCAAGAGCDPLWRGRTRGRIVAAPVVTDGRVFVASSEGRVYAFRESCGSGGRTCPPEWVGRTGGPVDEPPVVTGGLVFVASTDGTLAIFRESCVSACRPIAEEPIGALPTRPAPWAGRVLYTLSADGVLTAYTVGGAQP